MRENPTKQEILHGLLGKITPVVHAFNVIGRRVGVDVSSDYTFENFLLNSHEAFKITNSGLNQLSLELLDKIRSVAIQGADLTLDELEEFSDFLDKESNKLSYSEDDSTYFGFITNIAFDPTSYPRDWFVAKSNNIESNNHIALET